MALTYRDGDEVPVRGDCGHTLFVETTSFNKSGSHVPYDDTAAHYVLRCRTCGRGYRWRVGDAAPRAQEG